MKYSFPLTPESWATADWPTQDDLFPPFIHTKQVIWGTPKLPPFSISWKSNLHIFGLFFSPSFSTHFWGYCHFGPRTEKSILWKPDEAKAFMLLNMCAVIFAVLAPHVMMWNAANVEKRRANMNVMCPQQEMGHRKSTLYYYWARNGSQLLTQKRTAQYMY